VPETASPLVSIITPAYNAAAFVSETIESALAQTFHNFELVIVDDGSTDSTLEIARTYSGRDARVRVFSGRNGGPSAARNAAMRQARGSFFALLDSDDLWLPTFLTEQIKAFDRFPHADVMTCNAYNLGGPRDGRPLQAVQPDFRIISLIDMLAREDAVCIMSVFRRAVVDRIGAFDESLTGTCDYDFWIRAAHAGCVFVENPAVLGQYRRRSDSLSADEIQMLDGIIRVLRHARELCVDRPPERAVIDRQLARFDADRLLASAKARLLRREYTEAARDFEALAGLRGDFFTELLARISRRIPGILLLVYRLKLASKCFSTSTNATKLVISTLGRVSASLQMRSKRRLSSRTPPPTSRNR